MVAVAVKYPAGHTYKTLWERLEDMHCPACGKKAVWHDAGGGDYYVGEEHMCSACATTWTMQLAGPAEGVDTQILEAIRAAE